MYIYMTVGSGNDFIRMYQRLSMRSFLKHYNSIPTARKLINNQDLIVSGIALETESLSARSFARIDTAILWLESFDRGRIWRLAAPLGKEGMKNRIHYALV